jgi:pimeloyl-ACP methyl ester carboxylesterase
VGCNSSGWEKFPNAFYSTETFASDVTAVIENQKLNDYYIYGTSYGTALATTLAYNLTKTNLPQPQAVVLEGTVGKSFKQGQELSEYLTQWHRVQAELTEPAFSQLRQKTLPFSLSGKQWAGFIESFLTLGDVPSLGDWFASLLGTLDPSMPQQKRDDLQKMILESESTSVPASFERLFKVVSCQELSDSISGSQYDFDLVQGKLIPLPSNYCGDLKLSNPFDSAYQQISAPIIYFQGDHDPATPIWQARYHFANQHLSKRTFITVENGGHASLDFNLSDCKQRIWMAIASNDSQKLEDSTKSCKLKTKIEIQMP